jgi:hypothetical protein
LSLLGHGLAPQRGPFEGRANPKETERRRGENQVMKMSPRLPDQAVTEDLLMGILSTFSKLPFPLKSF